MTLPDSAALICWPTATPMAWNSGMAAYCTPTYGDLGKVLSLRLALSMAFFSAAANLATFWNSGFA
ncbi:hypothetical protein D3C87_1356970 [compost metagenome]